MFLNNFIISCVIVAIFSIYYYILVNTYGEELNGTLIDTKTITCQIYYNKYNNNIYYIGETYLKNNNKTCLIQRLRPYLFEGSADNARQKTVNITKKIWTTWYNFETCYDESIKNTINFINFILVLIYIIIILILTVIHIYVKIYKYIKQKIGNKNEQKFSNYFYNYYQDNFHKE